jgi:micrococcal nuclease
MFRHCLQLTRKFSRAGLGGVALVLVVVAILVLEATTTGSAAGTVEKVTDGDTIVVAGVGKVRLIGIDAMDAWNKERAASQAAYYGMSQERVRHWAEAASARAKQALAGKRVILAYGPERRDRYGRALAYVHLPAPDGTAGADFQLMMLREGLAAAYRKFNHPRKPAYLAAEAEAKSARKGLWADAAK